MMLNSSSCCIVKSTTTQLLSNNYLVPLLAGVSSTLIKRSICNNNQNQTFKYNNINNSNSSRINNTQTFKYNQESHVNKNKLCTLLNFNSINNNNYNQRFINTSNNVGTVNGSNGTLRKVLTKEQQEIFNKNVKLLEDIKKELFEFNVSEEQLQVQIDEALEQLNDALFLLVIVGEFNSGKSSFLNALLGNTYLKEGITPTTSKINIITYGEKAGTVAGRNAEQEQIQLPVSWLHDIGLVDTPGTNAIIRSHQEITEHFVPRSDMVLFVTSVDRAFSESERRFLETIRQWRKKIVVVLSKSDLVESNPMSTSPEADLAEVRKFVEDNFKTMLGVAPSIFPVSSKLALKAKLAVARETANVPALHDARLADNAAWKASRFAELERYIMTTLDSAARTRLKLLNPLGVAEHVLAGLNTEITARGKVLAVDLRTLQHVEQQQLDGFRDEMVRDLEFHLQRIDNVLLKMETRADAFLDDQIQFGNLFKLLRSDEVKLRFEKEVVGTTSHEIEAHISSLIDWIVDKNAKQWRAIMEYIDARSSARLEKLIGSVNRAGDFLSTRKSLLESVSEQTSSTIRAYDKESESTKISQEIRKAIFQTAAIEVGAVGIGTILTASLLDLSGIIGIGILAISGLALLPIKKNSLKKSVHLKISDLRVNLSNVMRVHFETELESGIQRMKDGISPFSTYVHVESKKLTNSQQRVKDYTESITNIRDDIDRLK